MPLALQVGLLIWMSSLQSEAEAALKNAEHMKLLSDGINKLNAEEFESVNKLGHMHQLDNTTDELIDEIVRRTTDDYSAIKEQAKSEPALFEEIKSIERDQIRAFSLAKKVRATEDYATKVTMWRQLGYQVQDVMYGRLVKLARRYSDLARQSSEEQTEKRQNFQKVALWGGGITMAISAIIGFALAGSISLRLNRLIDNNMRLAANRPLHETMSGRDEIAKIDQTFHNMATTLEQAARRERAVIDHARDLICSISRGKFTAANPASFELLGYTKDELFGIRVVDVIAESKDVAAEFVSSLRDHNEGGSVEVRMRTKDGRVVDTLWSTQWSDEEKSMFCVIHDISERRAAERLRQEIVHMITHDLRTPLTTLAHIFEILIVKRKTEPEEKQLHYLEVGEKSVSRLSNLVNDLLDIEKVRSGQMTIELKPVDLSLNFETCFDSVNATAESKNVKINIHDTTLMVSGDSDKIDRVLINLVGNAIKFSPDGGAIDLYAETVDGMAKVVIKDQGKGIAPEEIEKVFERFHQVQGTQEKGSGLGLTICRAFVELHGGTIWAESEPGKGTSFCFTLPLATVGKVANTAVLADT
ncbi:MAG TPA: ATP-binding protein [Drouetiella sp.]